MGELAAAFGGAPDAAAAGEPSRKNNFWATAAMVLIGTAALGGALIYATWSKKTDPATVLQPDANGMPVQPINPATGTEEQQLAVMPPRQRNTVLGVGFVLFGLAVLAKA